MNEKEKLKGKRLKEIIEENNFTQERFASEVLHTSHGNLRNILSGVRRVTSEHAEAVVKHFPYVNYEWLMGISDIKTTAEWFSKYGNDAFQCAHYKFAAAEMLIKALGYEINDISYPDQNTVIYELRDPDGEVCTISSEKYKEMIFNIFDDVNGKLLLTFKQAQTNRKSGGHI